MAQFGPFSLDDDPSAPTVGDAAPAPAAVPADIAPAVVSAPAVQLSAEPAPAPTVEPDGAPAGAELGGMTPTQRRTHSELLAVGAQRPYTPPRLADDLRGYLKDATKEALDRWTESSLYLTKAKLTSALSCEGRAAADMATPWSGTMHPATAVGTVAHRAIQVAHTHPGRPVAEYVTAAINASVRADSGFEEFYVAADLGTQSDVISQATSKVTLFLDSWPRLVDDWTPRFEEPLQAKVGRLTLSARPDLILGRPRSDGRRTVFMCDFKTGSLSDRHDVEAMFYALVATLRHGVMPFRSAVYSLASAEWASPELSAETLSAFAQQVAQTVVATVDVMTDVRPARLTPGPHCVWCPVSATCPSSTVASAAAPAPAAALTVDSGF